MRTEDSKINPESKHNLSDNQDLNKSLQVFDPILANWFIKKFKQPTPIQTQAWPIIASGAHVLLSAPTGSGKTLSAFLWALNQIFTRSWHTGGVNVVYISPLKALNNDIQKNLVDPLNELHTIFQRAGQDLPLIRTMVRSGDTPQSEREKILRHPPEILITTPESLSLLLSTPRGQNILQNIKQVILDEVHAVAATRRGVHLMSGIERLVQLSGEFQRVALSATVRPLKEVAAFVGGYQCKIQAEHIDFQARPVVTLKAPGLKEYDIQVTLPAAARNNLSNNDGYSENFLESIAVDFRRIIKKHRSTIVFTNSRQMAEKLARLINEDQPDRLALCHHGSLSREIRLYTEQLLKTGQLPCIVATSSLELGIDIGNVDRVLMVQTPFGVASSLQRIGRAGHGVGEVSYGRFYPTHERDLLQSALIARLVIEGDIEEFRPIQGALDVLAQVIVSIVVVSGKQGILLDHIYNTIRTVYSFHHVDRRQFDLIIRMLTGWYAGTRIRELKVRLALDATETRAIARKGARMVLFMSGGTIPDRGYYDLRLLENKARIGQLDEEFVWERRIGDTFMLANRRWRIEKIDHNDVFVNHAHEKSSADIPFWRAEERNYGWHLGERLGIFLEEADNELEQASGKTPHTLLERLEKKHHLNKTLSADLIAYLIRQRQATQSALPHRHHILMELVDKGNHNLPGNLILHTFWGGAISTNPTLWH